MNRNSPEIQSSSLSEKALISLMINFADSREKIINYIEEKNFYDVRHRHLFRIIRNLDLEKNMTKIDWASLRHELEKESLLDKVITINYLKEIVTDVGYKSNLDNLMHIVVEEYKIRKIKKFLFNLSIKMKTKNFKSSDDILVDISTSVNNLWDYNKTREFEDVKQVIPRVKKEIYDRIQNKGIQGISTGFKDLDELTNGFQEQELFILAARTSVGKTAFAINLAVNVAKKYPVAFFSLEMSSESLVKRMISFIGDVDGKYIKRPNLLINNSTISDSIEIASNKIKKLNLFIDDSGGLKLKDLIWKVSRLVKTQNLKVVFVDYLQLINLEKSFGNNRQNQVSHISRALKLMAKDHNITIVALSQLSRDIERRENKRPFLSDIRESGSIEQDADLIAFLHREDYYAKHSSEDKEIDEKTLGKPQHSDVEQIVDVIISKHRNGPTGDLEIHFTTNTGRFSDIKYVDPSKGKY